MSARIVTTHVFPPIPMRQFDWCAHDEDYEDRGIVGWGRTEAEAIADYLTQVSDDLPSPPVTTNPGA